MEQSGTSSAVLSSKIMRAKNSITRASPSGTKPPPACSNISLSFFPKLCHYPRHPDSKRGAFRGRHDTRGGMRWTPMYRATSDADADGEVVWSWRPDAGAKRVEEFSRATVTTKP